VIQIARELGLAFRELKRRYQAAIIVAALLFTGMVAWLIQLAEAL
jgi:hypothetical protein